MNQQKTSLKEKAISEAKKFAVIVGYLWVLFVLFEIHKITILRGQSPATPLGYRVGFAFINALILGKIILIADAFSFGEGFKNRPLVYAILFKSAVFSVLLVCFDIFGGSDSWTGSSQDDHPKHANARRRRRGGDVAGGPYGVHCTDTVFFL